MKMWKTFLLIVTILLLLECDPIQAWRRRRRRRRSSCDTTACAWSWSSCSKTCGNGIRSATITRRQGSCGACDPPEPETCNVQFCPDIIECSSDERKECDENGKCLNIVGSYQCQCSDGYTGDGKTCSDINECDAGSHYCHPWATCKNTPGSFTCKCPEGFSGDGRDCESITENVDCIDNNGTIECVCMKGYEGNGINCTDIDECSSSDEKNECDENGKCLNIAGSYQCQCSDGYTGDGKICSVLNECLSNREQSDDCNTGVPDLISRFFYGNKVLSIVFIIVAFMIFTSLVFSVYRCWISRTKHPVSALQDGDSDRKTQIAEGNLYEAVKCTKTTIGEENLQDNLYVDMQATYSKIRDEAVAEENPYVLVTDSTNVSAEENVYETSIN